MDFGPTKGDELQKIRPALVVSSNATIRGKLQVRLVAPITGWKDHFANLFWHVRIEPDEVNGLSKTSSVNALQLRGVDVQRFQQRVGRVSATLMEEVAAAIAGVVEYK